MCFNPEHLRKLAKAALLVHFFQQPLAMVRRSVIVGKVKVK
jgi:hypothetical protein